MKLLDRLADKLGYEKKRPKVPRQIIYTSRSRGTWRMDVETDDDWEKIQPWPNTELSLNFSARR